MLLQPRRLSLISLPGSQIRLNGAWTQRLKARCSNGSVQPPATAPSRRRPPSKDSNENGRRRVPDPTCRPGAHQQILQQRGGADSSDGQGSQGTSRHGAVAAPAVTTPAATNTVSGRHLNRSAPSNVVTPLQSTTAANSAISNHHLVHTGTYIHNSYARPGSEPSTNSQQLPPARRGHGPLEPQRRVDQTKRPAGHGGASWDQRSFSDDGSGSSTRSSSTSMANPSDAAPNRQLTGWKSDGAANGSGGGGVGGGRKTAMSFKGAAKQINADIMEAGRKGNWQVILQLVAQHGAQFNSVNAATALHRLGSCGLQPGSWEARKLLTDPRFAQLERLAEAHVPSFGPREAANCLWALAKLGCDPPPSKDNDADLNQSYGGKGDGAHLGGLMSRSRGGSAVAPAAAADHDHDHDDGTGSTGRSSASSEAGGSLLAALCGRMEVLLECLGQQEVTNVLWALGTLGHHPGEALLRNLSMRLLGLLAEVPPQGIASSLLGLAKLGWSPGPYVLDQVARGSVAKIGEFNAQALSNTMWSLARLGYYNPQLQDAMFRQALRRLSEFSPQGISNLIWAAATLGLTVVSEGDGNGSGRPGGCGEGEKGGGSTIPSGDVPEPLLRTFCDQAAVSLQSYSPQNISNLLWSTAKMGYLHEPLMRAAATQAAGQLAAEVEEREGREEEQLEEEAEENDRGDSSASASSSSSSNMRRRDGDRRGGGGGGRATGAWNSQEVANATWAYATLGFQPGAEFLKQVCRHLSSPVHVCSYKWQEVANTVWALASLGHRDTEALREVEREVADRIRSGSGSSSGIRNTRGREKQGGDVMEPLTPSRSLQEEDEEEGVAEGAHEDRPQSRLLPSKPHQLRPQHISNLLWSYASLQHPAPQLFTALMPLLVRHLPQFSKQEISNSVWAAGRLQVYDPRVMDAVAEHVCAHRLPYLKPQEVANIAWAFGALRHAHKPLMDGLVRRAVHFMSTPPSSSSSSLSSPSSSSSSSSLSSATPFQISPSMPLLSPCPSSSSPSAHRRYDNPHDEDVVTRRPPVSGSLKMQELASICGAVGLFGWRYPALLEATTRRLTAYINQATQSTSPSAPTPRHETIQGIQHQHQQQEAHRAERCQPQQQQQELKARDIVNLSWGLSLVGGCSPELWGQMMELLGQLAGQRGHAGGGGGGERLMELPQEELVQIYQTFLHVQLDFPVTTATAGPDAGGGLHTSPPGLLVAGREAWRQLSQQGAQVSSFQWEVSKTLTRLGLNHSVELLTSGGKFSIDLALELVAEVEMEMEQAKEDNMESGEVMGPAALTEQPKQQQPQPHLHYQPRGRDEGKRRDIRDSCNSSNSSDGASSSGYSDDGTPVSTSETSRKRVVRVAVEVDGPTHFTSNTRQPLSTTLYRRRCLEARGWVVVSVPYWRWSSGGCSPQDQEVLLQELMRQEGLLLRGDHRGRVRYLA